MPDATPRADRLFPADEPEVLALARRIEAGEAITLTDLAPVADMIDRRYGDDITLLFHSVASGNVAAVDAILAAGADTGMTDKATGSTRDFVYYLTLPGGPLMEMDEINEMIRSYLRHGGNPDATTRGNLQQPLVAALAVISNEEGIDILLGAGADPWAWALNNGRRYGTAMSYLAWEERNFPLIDRLIDRGLFDAVPQDRLEDFLDALGGYAQRGDDQSLGIQRIAMRVLKRNPHYVETSDEARTASIFRNHWEDPPATIPWDIIRSGAVQ
ncbi:MAG: hypothetical protein JJT81_05005 [Rubellimicrobium sp.]|nr:hypothetical protein [Rubellimicrobium sp.]